MRILYIACGSGSDCTLGGSLIRTTEIAKRLQKTSDIYFLTTSGGREAVKDLFSEETIYEIKTSVSGHTADKNFLWRQLWTLLSVMARSASAVKKIPEVDVVYLDSDGPWDIIPTLFYKRRFPKAKMVSMIHHRITLRKDSILSFLFSFINVVIQKISFFFIHRFADVIFVLETPMGQGIKEYFLSKKFNRKIFAVRNGIDKDFIDSIPEEIQEYDVCFLGALRPSKGLYDIVPIWKKVCAQKKDAKLIILGGMLYQYRQYLNQEIKKNNLENNIILSDYVPDKQGLFRFVKKARVFIAPSHEEGWGIAIMECMACGLPGVLWNIPIFEKIIAQGVLKVLMSDIKGFSGEVFQLLTDDNLHHQLREEALAWIPQYDWNLVAQKEEEILSSLF